MRTAELLIDAFGRVRDLVEASVEGLTVEELAHRVEPEANTIAWLVWHLTRIQDDHIAAAAGTDQVWVTGGWEAILSLRRRSRRPPQPLLRGHHV